MRSRIADVFFALILLLVLPVGAFAEDYTDRITDQLRRQGFREIVVSRTFLGRHRILATTDKVEREIIVNPGTGEILRDYSENRQSDRHSRGLLGLFEGLGSSGSDSASDSGDDDSGDDGEEASDAEAGGGSGEGADGSADGGEGESGDGDD